MIRVRKKIKLEIVEEHCCFLEGKGTTYAMICGVHPVNLESLTHTHIHTNNSVVW